MIDILQKYWAVVSGFVAVLFWAFSVEARGLSNSRDLKQLKQLRSEDLGRAKEQRDRMERQLDEIKESLRSIQTHLMKH